MRIFNQFKHLNLSQGQGNALIKLEAFLDSPVPVFMLKGYAGSGKTTILKGLVEYLNAIEKDFALMPVLDFEYKKNGLFGRVVPIQNMTYTKGFSGIQTALQTFKQKEYAS